MNTKNLGRLREVELREAWSPESSDLTPWLQSETAAALDALLPPILDKAFKGEL